MRLGNPRNLIEGILIKYGKPFGFEKQNKPVIRQDKLYICINKNGKQIGKLKAESLRQAKVGFAARFKYGEIREVQKGYKQKNTKKDKNRTYASDIF